MSKQKPTSFLTVDQITDGCCVFVNDYFKENPNDTSPISLVVNEYFKSVKTKLLLSVFQKINTEKLIRFIETQRSFNAIQTNKNTL